YRQTEVVDVLLGQGNDTFTVNATLGGAITVVQGGGGADAITVKGGGGAASPLIVFGDTSQDGSWDDSTNANVPGRARQFSNFGNDNIDASLSLNSLAIYSGLGNDIIQGSQAGDHLAGGSGNDTIYGGGGADHIYGDDGFKVDLSSRLSLSTQVLV